MCSDASVTRPVVKRPSAVNVRDSELGLFPPSIPPHYLKLETAKFCLKHFFPSENEALIHFFIAGKIINGVEMLLRDPVRIIFNVRRRLLWFGSLDGCVWGVELGYSPG